MADWRTTTIGGLCDDGAIDIQTGPFGSQLHAYDYVDDGVPVVPTEAIAGRRIEHSVLPRIPTDKAAELSRHRLHVGDILFARRGVQATGNVAIVRPEEEGFLCGTGAIRLRVNGPAVVGPDFLSHVFADPASVAWFKFHAIGATMPNLNEGIIRSFPLQLPPLGEQRAIAAILGAFDYKIELNRRMSETLEVMARALFKSWFVDFDAPEWASESDMNWDGDAPSGRRVGTLADICDLNPESWRLGLRPDVVRYVDLTGVKWGRMDKPTLHDGDAPSRARRILRPGDTIVGTVRPGNGSFTLVTEDGLTGSTGFAVLRPHRPEDRAFVYLAATSPDNVGRLAHLADGAAYPAVRPDVVAKTEVGLPPAETLSAFGEAANPLLDRVAVAERESRTLGDIRDALLPRLISGELRAPDAERLAVEAGV